MKTIFCPIDFSKESEIAAYWAIAIAEKTNSQLVLFNKYMIFNNSAAGKNVNEEEDPFVIGRKEAEAKLLSLKNKLCTDLKIENLQFSLATDYGIDTDEVIANAAEKANADLIIMGTNGTDGLFEYLDGSNTSNVIDKTEIPVLVIPETATKTIPDSIIYATDVKNENAANLNFVLNLVSGLNTKVTFLHVLKNNEESKLSKIKHFVEKNFSSSPNTNQNNLQISYDEIAGSNVFTSIQQYANSKNAQLIILERNQKNIFEKLIKGDLTNVMALHSIIPILIMHKRN